MPNFDVSDKLKVAKCQKKTFKCFVIQNKPKEERAIHKAQQNIAQTQEMLSRLPGSQSSMNEQQSFGAYLQYSYPK